MKERLPYISVIIPCLNEANFIRQVIIDILHQDYPTTLMEVFFVDGGSTDNTREIIQQYASKNPQLILLDNPDRFVPQAMNLGIQKSKGDVIIRLDAHASYPPDYFPKLITCLARTGADNVGGVWKIAPRNNGMLARAIAIALSHPLGVGNAMYRLDTLKEMEVDTVPFGCFRRNAFERFGEYDNRLHRNQDIEFNKRIKKMGGSIILDPTINCTYFARDNFSALWKNNFENGRWVILTAKYTNSFQSLSLRHFIPFLFVLYLLLVLALCVKWIFWGSHHWLEFGLVLPAIIYILLIIIFSFFIALKEGSPGLFSKLATSFLCLHISYGLGSFAGLLLSKKNS